MVGTPVYMSPEQCRGGEGVDHRSDIYAFGCLLFHMVTGRPPFVGDATGDLIVAHLEEDPPAPSLYVADLPVAFDALVLRCLAKAPGDRFQSMTEVQTAINEIYGQLDGTDVIPATVPHAVPLGRGFRSIYDANFASRAGGTPAGMGARQRLPWLPMSPPPASSSDEFDRVVPRRASFRAVLACVLVLGVAVGLLSTSYVIYSNDRREQTHAMRRAATSADSATTPQLPGAAPLAGQRAPAAAPALAAAAETSASEPSVAEPSAAAPAAASRVIAGTAATAQAWLTAPVTPAADIMTSAGPVESARRSPTSPGTGEQAQRAPEMKREPARETTSAARPERKPEPKHEARSAIQREIQPEPRTETRPEARASARVSATDRAIEVPPPRAAPPSDPAPPAPLARPAPPATEDLYDTR